MYRAATEGILGIRRRGGHLVIAPCLPQDWPGITARLQVDGTTITVDVTRGGDAGRCPCAFVPLDGGCHAITLILS